MWLSDVAESWRAILAPLLDSAEGRGLADFLAAEEAAGKTIFPPAGNRFATLGRTPLERVRVVILGQDPYHGPGQAHGLAFSVPPGMPLPPSLRNIARELGDDLGLAQAAMSGDLSPWADQGVLLLNTALTVEAGKAGSHQRCGWDAVTDAVVRAVAERDAPSVFMLWGSHAQGKAARVARLGAETPHLVLTSAHPSPLSAHRGFFGSRPFSRANAFLEAAGRGVIDWTLG